MKRYNNENRASDNLKKEIQKLSDLFDPEFFTQPIDVSNQDPRNKAMAELYLKLMESDQAVYGPRRNRLKEYLAEIIDTKANEIELSDPELANRLHGAANRLRPK